ncbi:hypothetical protein AH06_79 [Erwinia phage AH06]|nr:hypothetical protein AH06_79 [Erwinia phage AH06]
MEKDIQTTFKERYGDLIKPGNEITVPLYHISFHGDREGIWIPKVPDSPFDTPKNPSISYEMPIPRICVAPSIEQCFWAIYPNISHYFEEENYAAMCFTVYRPMLNANSAVVDTAALTQRQLVCDAHVTGEHWLLGETFMEIVDQIRINNTSAGEFVKYRPYNSQEGYEWELAPKNVVYTQLTYCPCGKE